MARILSVHQANFIPWLGFFDKIAKSDVFVILDEVQMPRGKSPANRNSIKTANGKVQLTVPISHPKGSQNISTYKEVILAEPRWHKKALRSLEHAYSKAPFFDEVFPFLERNFQSETLFEMNCAFIIDVVERLELKTEMIMQSDLSLPQDQKNNEMIIGIAKAVNADAYLSGQGARSYNDPESYKANGIGLSYQEFEHPEYEQVNGEFISHLSIIDALVNIGYEGTARLLTQ